MSLVKNGPHPENAQEGARLTMSDKGQAIWANAYLRPIRPAAMTPGRSRPSSRPQEYKRAKVID